MGVPQPLFARKFHDHACPECGAWIKNCDSGLCPVEYPAGAPSRGVVFDPTKCRRCASPLSAVSLSDEDEFGETRR